MRSIFAVLALMVASAAGGFLYSEFLKQRNAEDMRAMRDELKDLRALIAQGRDQAHGSDAAAASQPAGMVMPIAMDGEGVEDTVESIAYVPACRRTDAATACAEADAQRIALCGTVPSYARVDRIDLFAQPDAVQHPWESHQVTPRAGPRRRALHRQVVRVRAGQRSEGRVRELHAVEQRASAHRAHPRAVRLRRRAAEPARNARGGAGRRRPVRGVRRPRSRTSRPTALAAPSRNADLFSPRSVSAR